MAFVRWHDQPTLFRLGEEMGRIQREMNRFMHSYSGLQPSHFRTGVFPPVNLTEDENNFTVRSELPGVDPEAIDISVEGETVTLRGERKLQAAENVNYHRREREAGRFRRVLSLPTRVNAEAVQATCRNGVLKIVLPKAEEAKPKQVRITTG
jgi:HSP20 family protein